MGKVKYSLMLKQTALRKDIPLRRGIHFNIKLQFKKMVFNGIISLVIKSQL